MALNIKMLKQWGVYWPPTAPEANGRRGTGSPVLVKVRWTISDSQVVKPDGTYARSSASVFTEFDVLPGGFLALMDSKPDTLPTEIPTENSGEIMAVKKVPNFKAKWFIRKAFL